MAAKKLPATADEWAKESEKLRTALVEKSLGGLPAVKPQSKWVEGFEDTTVYTASAEPGLNTTLVVRFDPTIPRGKQPLAVIVTVGGTNDDFSMPLVRAAYAAGWSTLTFDLRATGQHAQPSDKIGRAPDHNTAEWGLWTGRPLLGQWVNDVRQMLSLWNGDKKREVAVIGVGPAGLVALCAAATDKRITKAAAVGTLASYFNDTPYEGQRLGVMAPGIVRDVGDVPHIAALAAPKRVVIAGGVMGSGKQLTGGQLREAYQPAAKVWELLKAQKELVVEESTDAAKVIAALK